MKYFRILVNWIAVFTIWPLGIMLLAVFTPFIMIQDVYETSKKGVKDTTERELESMFLKGSVFFIEYFKRS